MEEKPIEAKKEGQPQEPKKFYKPPALIVYGKLAELTASGTQLKKESTGHPFGLP